MNMCTSATVASWLGLVPTPPEVEHLLWWVLKLLKVTAGMEVLMC